GCCEVSDWGYADDLLLGRPLRDVRFTDDGDHLRRRFSGNRLGSVGHHHVSDFLLRSWCGRRCIGHHGVHTREVQAHDIWTFLQVDVHTGAIAETILSFGITFAALLIIIRGPRRLLAKTFLLALATICFVVAGSKYTGPAMNPAIAFGWAYMYSSHNTWDHFYVYWISSFVGALSAALICKQKSNSKQHSHSTADLDPSKDPPQTSASSATANKIRYRSPSASELLESGLATSPTSDSHQSLLHRRRENDGEASDREARVTLR
ncbi:unnamed protein product, partial [Brassica napus]